MRESDSPSATSPLQAIFESAKCFGVSDDEFWQTVDQSFCAVDIDVTVRDYLDELSGALARRLLAKQRVSGAEEPF